LFSDETFLNNECHTEPVEVFFFIPTFVGISDL